MCRRAELRSRLPLLLVIAVLCSDSLHLATAKGTASSNSAIRSPRKASSSTARAPNVPASPHKPTKRPKHRRKASPSVSKPVKNSPVKQSKSPHKPRRSPRKQTKSPRKASPKHAPAPRPSPRAKLPSPPRSSTPRPSKPATSSPSVNYSPVAANNLPCYPGPYSQCTAALPGGPALEKAPNSNLNQFINTSAVLLPPGTYTDFAINANEGYYLSGTYTFQSFIINGYLTCGQPGGPQTDIDITATYIAVAGIFHCGRFEAPYTSKVTITMQNSGTREGQKHVAVTGWLMMVGRARKAWTQISDTVAAGATTFTTTEPVDWLPGERIVMTSTSFNPNHTEEAIIASVSPSGSGSQVRVTTPFQYAHFGKLQNYPTVNGAVSVLDERAEVALLDRNIMIQGDAASETNGQGAFMTMYEGGNAWLRDVKFFRVGQKSQLGRYPVHWHLTGDRAGNHITNSVIYKSWNRCMSIHATNYVKVVSTVCYDHIGHGYMIEDSCEHSNVFRNNLGIRTRLPATMAEGIIDTDTTNLATFWITNTLNHYIGNVVAASDGAGFWIMLPSRPIHLCASNSIFPDMNVQALSMARFDDNAAHSSNVGLAIEGGVCDTTRAEKCNGIYIPPDVPQVNRLRSYKCTHSFRTAWITVDKMIKFDSCVFGDNGGSILLSGSQIMTNTLIVGQSANTLQDTTPPARMGFGLYDGPAGLVNSHFAGFDQPGFRCILPVTSAFKKWNAFVQGVTFDPAIPKRNRFVQTANRTLSEMFMQGLIDVDGSLTGTPGTTLIGAPAGINNTRLPVGRQDADFQIPPGANCAFDADWQIWLCRGVTWGSVRINHFFPPASRARIVDVIRSDGKQATIDANIRIWYQFNAILNAGLTYRVVYRDTNSITLGSTGAPAPFEVELSFVDPGASTTLSLENLPTGAWSWTAYDCTRKVQVFTGRTGTTIPLTLTATGQASGPFPNQKYAVSKVRLCVGAAASCTC